MNDHRRERFLEICREIGRRLREDGVRLRIALHRDRPAEAFLAPGILARWRARRQEHGTEDSHVA